MHIDSCSSRIHVRRRSHHTLSGARAQRITFITLFCADRVIIRGGRSRWDCDLVWGCERSLMLSINDSPGTVQSLSFHKCGSMCRRNTGGWLYLIPRKCLRCHSYRFRCVMGCSKSAHFYEEQFGGNGNNNCCKSRVTNTSGKKL